jgi:Ca2+-binding EF-hand superfamily protein
MLTNRNLSETQQKTHVFQEFCTKTEVMHMFQKMNTRIEELERTVTLLKQTQKNATQTAPTKKEILTQLNEYDTGATPTIDFKTMLDLLQTTITLPNSILEDRTLKLDDLVISMMQTLRSHISTHQSIYENHENANVGLPFINFKEYHKHTLFVYSDGGSDPCKSDTTQWTTLTQEQLQRMIQKIHVSLINQCNRWRETFIDKKNIKEKMQNKETMCHRYTDMVARICNVSPHTNQAMLARIKKAWIELVAEENTFRLI